MQFKDKKIISSPNIDGENGSYSVESPLVFEKCRERFAVTFSEDLPGFYFLHRSGRSESIASFVRKTELILESDTSSFALTNRDRITWVEPSMFWKVCAMRRSLLTCLLRAGTIYDLKRDNYEEALYAEPYLGRTKRAVMRFLFGFTRYVGVPVESTCEGSSVIIKGWLSIFEFKDDEFICDNLICPENKKTVKLRNDLGAALWY